MLSSSCVFDIEYFKSILKDFCLTKYCFFLGTVKKDEKGLKTRHIFIAQYSCIAVMGKHSYFMILFALFLVYEMFTSASLQVEKCKS